MKKGDVSAAFLQGREFTRDLHIDTHTRNTSGDESGTPDCGEDKIGLLWEAPIKWLETMKPSSGHKSSNSSNQTLAAGD